MILRPRVLPNSECTKVAEEKLTRVIVVQTCVIGESVLVFAPLRLVCKLYEKLCPAFELVNNICPFHHLFGTPPNLSQVHESQVGLAGPSQNPG